MDHLNVSDVTRMGLILAHLVTFALAVTGISFGDVAIFRDRRIDADLLQASAKLVTGALVMLWITGIAIIWIDTAFDPAVVLARPKLLVKLTVVELLSLNGALLHHFAFPRFSSPQKDRHAAALMPAVLGAVSVSTWLFAAFVGVGKAVAVVLGYMGFMTLYAFVVSVAIAISLVWIRPRLARQLSLSGLSRTIPARTSRQHGIAIFSSTSEPIILQ